MCVPSACLHASIVMPGLWLSLCCVCGVFQVVEFSRQLGLTGHIEASIRWGGRSFLSVCWCQVARFECLRPID